VNPRGHREARLVNPVGTAFRSLLGSRDERFEWRVVWMVQVVTIALSLKLGGLRAGAIILADVLVVTTVMRNRTRVRAWRQRAWGFSERVWWL
jgi:hypothetical protein